MFLDCYIIENPPVEIEIKDNDMDTSYVPEPEMLADTGIHFMEQPSEMLQDPLAPSTSQEFPNPKGLVDMNFAKLGFISVPENEYRRTCYKGKVFQHLANRFSSLEVCK